MLPLFSPHVNSCEVGLVLFITPYRRFSMNKKLWIGLMALCAITFNAKAIPLELGLAIDGSGSISSANFSLQRTGYVNALTDVLPIDGSVAVGVWQFGTTVTQVFAVTLIDSAAAKTALINAIAGMTQVGGNTALGPAIQTAATALLGNAITSDRQVIDVSTDGEGNTGISQTTASANALAAGIDQINGLGIGAGANLNFVGGTGSFGVTATSFATFESTLTTKLHREITGAPDAGNTLILLSLGILGLAGLRRMRLAA